MTNLHLAPVPKVIDVTGNFYTLPRERTIVLHGEAIRELGAARTLQTAIERYVGATWPVRAAAGIADNEGIVAVIDHRIEKPEGYHLTIGDERIGIVARDGAGLAYAFATLTQLLRQFGRRLPRLHIEDEPAYRHRGVMLDVSRDRVPTLEAIYGLTDILAEWKINQLQLYMEHMFAYEQHRAVWKDASPFTGEEILALDAYCRERHIELVPNQNSFGHMERWLKRKPYSDLAEAPRGITMPWGKLPPFSINPADPRSLSLIDGLYAELLPHFRSTMFNVGCDETFDLGRDRNAHVPEGERARSLYLAFLLKIHGLCEKYGRRMMFWGDIVIQHPDLIGEIPRDTTVLEWGYEHDHPFERDSKAFARAGLPFYVCPGAGGWNSFFGRTDNAVENIRNAAASGRKHRAAGMLTTEWGDNGHMQPMPAAYLGLLYGAAMSWSPDRSAHMDLAAALSLHAFDDPSGTTGRVAYDLGNAYQVPGAKTRNGSLLQQLYFVPIESDWPMQRARPGGFDEAREYIAAALARIEPARMRRPDAALVARELRNASALASAGAAIGAAKQARFEGAPVSRVRGGLRRAAREIEAAVPEYERLWLERSRSGGRKDSVARLHRTAKSLRAAAEK